MRKRLVSGRLLCLPLAAGVAGLYLLPCLLALGYSFAGDAGHPGPTLWNYRQLLQNPAFGAACKNLLAFWAAALPLDLAIGLGLGLLLWRCMGQTALRVGFFMPGLLPAACAAAALQLTLGPLLTQWWGPAWLQGQPGFWALVGVYLWKSCGYTLLLVLAGRAAIPPLLYQAAQLDGAGPAVCFWRITLPLLRPSLCVSLVAGMVNGMRAYREAYLLGGAHPVGPLYLPGHFLANNFANLNYPRLAAASVLMVSGTALAAALVWRAFKKRGKGGASDEA